MPPSSGCRPICLFQLIRSINCVQFWIAVWKTLRNIFLTINKPTACDKAVGFLLLSLLCVVGGGVLDAPPICAPRFGPSGTPAPTHDRLHRLLAPPSGGSWQPEGLTEGVTPSFSPASPPHRWAPAPPPARPPRSTAGRSGGPRRTPPAGAAAGAPQAAAPAR